MSKIIPEDSSDVLSLKLEELMPSMLDISSEEERSTLVIILLISPSFKSLSTLELNLNSYFL